MDKQAINDWFLEGLSNLRDNIAEGLTGIIMIPWNYADALHDGNILAWLAFPFLVLGALLLVIHWTVKLWQAAVRQVLSIRLQDIKQEIMDFLHAVFTAIIPALAILAAVIGGLAWIDSKLGPIDGSIGLLVLLVLGFVMAIYHVHKKYQ